MAIGKKRAKSASKNAARKSAARKTTAKKTTAKKAAAKKTSAKKATTKRPSTTRKQQAMSLHIGLNAVDPRHYSGWSGRLAACEYDANDMATIAASRKMRSSVLLTRDATRANVLAGIRAAASALQQGDFFFLTYSGHGGQVDDITGEESDKQDETWCLFDGQLIDDELYLELGRFRDGVRVFVLSDSCHSGTVTRAMFRMNPNPAETGMRTKDMPANVARETYLTNKAFYDGLQRDVLKAAGRAPVEVVENPRPELIASPRLRGVATKFRPALILISGCQDNQTSMDGDRNGAFTEQLKAVWKNGAFTDDYARFHASIKARMPSSQTPNLFVLGDATKFLTERPFDVAPRVNRVSVGTARKFLENAPVPAPRVRERGTRGRLTRDMKEAGAEAEATTALALDPGRAQAAVVGSDIVSFAPGVTTERRESIVNCSMLAQLVAKKQAQDPSRVREWYNAYFDALVNLGWVIQDQEFSEYEDTGDSFDAHTAVLALATTLLGAAPSALATVTSAINASHKMDESTPWITLFNRESASSKTARFQVSIAEQDEAGELFVSLMAFALEAKSNVTQVLFFKARKREAKFRHFSGRVTINTGVLDAIQEELKAKLAGHASAFVKAIPDLG